MILKLTKKINEDTLNFAKKLSDKNPYHKKEYSFIEGPEIKDIGENEVVFSSSTLFDYIETIFDSRSFEFEFKKYYPSNFYDFLYNEIHNKRIINHTYGAFAILNSINYASDNPLDIRAWLESFSKKPLIEGSSEKESSNEQYLKIYETARIDITNERKFKNKFEILENSDNLSKVNFPKPFQKDGGYGCYITSTKGQINLKIKCIGDGKIKIFLKSLGLKDRTNTRFPIFIDYFKLTVNNKD